GPLPVSGWTLAEDVVRLAAESPSVPGAVERLAAGSGRERDGLGLAVHAWREGGAVALAVLEEEWTPEGEVAARACAALEAAWDPGERPALRPHANRWTETRASTQIRLDREGRWWPYHSEDGHWAPAGGPSPDPAAALAAASGDEADLL
ncbi:SWF or SNF family helicase, partial [Streptomyces sp. S6]